MTTLVEVQSRFQAFLLGRGGANMEELTVGTELLPAGERLAVYGDAYRLRLLEILGDDFPGLKGMIGDDAFDTLGAAYIDAFPSTHPSVRWFGRHLERFLRETSPYRDRSALAEMAAFEWAQGEVMDALDSPLVGIEELGALAPASWPGMRIAFQDALRRLDLTWNIPAVWKAIRDETDPPPLESTPSGILWLLWRRGVEVHWRPLGDEERRAIDAACEGASFGAICEDMLARAGDDEVPLRAAGFLKGWAGDGLIAALETRDWPAG